MPNDGPRGGRPSGGSRSTPVTKGRAAPSPDPATRPPSARPDEAASAARAFCDLFPALYLRFHRRDGKARELPAASRAVLQHLSVAGPLRIGELAKHLDRAQSVVSEIVSHLERDGLLERFRDARDKRIALTWLTEQGLAFLSSDREVLAMEHVARAMQRMNPSARSGLLRGMQALLEADNQVDLPATTKPRKEPP